MIIKTGRFGQLTVGDDETVIIPQGILGFPDYTKYCLVDPGDETLILWLQSIENTDIAFPILEPKNFLSPIIRPVYQRPSYANSSLRTSINPRCLVY